MTEREQIAEELERVIRPLLEREKYDEGYNCCGCSTYDMVLDHAIAIVKGEPYVHPYARPTGPVRWPANPPCEHPNPSIISIDTLPPILSYSCPDCGQQWQES